MAESMTATSWILSQWYVKLCKTENMVSLKWTLEYTCRDVQVTSLVPRPSPAPVFDRLQYGLGTRLQVTVIQSLQ